MTTLPQLLAEISSCRVCEAHLPYEPRPILAAGASSRVLIMGQAPGVRVHESGIPWNDPSGQRLRNWLGVSEDQFYDDSIVALVPMGFCYPGTGKSGDLPPRPECADLWHARLLAKLSKVELTLVVGRYAQQFFLRDTNRNTLTETVGAWQEYLPKALPLPHPSPRNNRWLKRNPWFEAEVVPYLRARMQEVLPV